MVELSVANFWTMYIMRNGFSQDFPCQLYDLSRVRGSRIPPSTDY